jgi:hypothetical protein
MAKEVVGGVSYEDCDGSQPKTPRIVPLTAAKISEWNSALEKIFSDMEESPCLIAASPPVHLPLILKCLKK